MRIDFVSDVACPWCAIGLSALERALERIGSDVGDVEIHMQPFELNPAMPPEGADAMEYMTSKYGLTAEQLAVNRARIVERGAAEGFRFGERMRVFNTFDAHRVTLAAPDDFDGWRSAARELAEAGIPPEAVVWQVEGGEGDLFGGAVPAFLAVIAEHG